MKQENINTDQGIEEFLGQQPKTGRSQRNRWIVAGTVALLVVIMTGIWFSSGSSGPRYATAEVKRGDMDVYVNATGNLKPTNEVSVGSELSGLIDTVYVDVNDRVMRGQPLAQIDREKLADQIRRSEAALQQARASVQQAQATIRQSRANLARLDEVRRISGGKVPSAADLDAARANYESDVASLASARASVLSALAQLATDQTNLSKATIRSPVNGVVLSREIEPGQTVAASFNTPTLFVIAEDLTQMELEVKVDEADVGQVREGQPATFTVDAYPGKQFKARITRVNVGSNSSSSSASSSTSTGSSTVVSYGAVLAVNNPDFALRPGMTATANILTSHQKNVLMIPNAALRFEPRSEDADQGGMSMFSGPGRDGGESQEVGIGRGSSQSVYILDEAGKLHRTNVRVGDSNGANTIVDGDKLKPGQKVVTGELAVAE